MKLKPIFALLTSIVLMFTSVQGGPSSGWRLSQWNVAGTSTGTRDVESPPSGHVGTFVIDYTGATPVGSTMSFGDGFQYTSGSPTGSISVVLSTPVQTFVDSSLDLLYDQVTTDIASASSSLATVAHTGVYSDLTGKPSLFSGAWADLTGKPSFATIATSGNYADLIGAPSLFSGAYTDLTGKPSLFSGVYSDLTSKPTLATVSSTGSYTDLINKPSLFSGVYSDLTGKPTLFTGNYGDLIGIPSTFTPSTHTHAMSDITGLSTALAGKETSGAAATAQAYAIQRANHTGSQAISTITNLQASLDAKGTGSVTSVAINSSNLTVTGSAITTSGTISVSLPNVVTAGTYITTTVDATGRITAGSSLAQASNSRSVVTSTSGGGTQLDTDRWTFVTYAITVDNAVTILTASKGYVALEICSTNSSTAGDWKEIGRTGSGGASLAYTSYGSGTVNGFLPAGWYMRLRSVNINGTPTYTFNSSQETKF